MTIEETKAILALLKTHYRNYFTKMSTQEAVDLLNLFHKDLEKYDFETVSNAVDVVRRREEYIPMPNKILEQIRIDKRVENCYDICEICKGTGFIAYRKNTNFGNANYDLEYATKCVCNKQQDNIPMYETIFGVPPMKRKKSEEQFNLQETLGYIRSRIRGIGRI